MGSSRGGVFTHLVRNPWLLSAAGGAVSSQGLPFRVRGVRPTRLRSRGRAFGGTPGGEPGWVGGSGELPTLSFRDRTVTTDRWTVTRRRRRGQQPAQHSADRVLAHPTATLGKQRRVTQV